METYHKINGIFKRHIEGPKKGKFKMGEWATPELEYLANNQWTFSRKVDGMNVRVGYRPTVAGIDGYGPAIEFGGRTDRAIIPTPLLEYLDKTFATEKFAEAFPSLDAGGVVLYGEGFGNGIQSGGKYREDVAFILFDVLIGGFWLSRANVADVANKLGIEVAPEIGTGTLHDAIDIVSTGLTFDKNGSVKRWGPGYLKSQWGDFPEEGIIARPLVDLFDRKGQRIICKIKDVDFR